MSIRDKISAFIDSYNTKFQELSQKLSEATTRAEELQLEINFIMVKELPEAKERRYIQGDAIQEKKLEKLLEKLEKELAEKQEEVVILDNYIKRFKFESAEKVVELEKLFRDEKRINDDKAYKKMLQHKEAYLTAMKKEAEAFTTYAKTNNQIQRIKSNAGLRPSYSEIEIPYHIDLTVSRNDVVKYVKGL